MFGQAISRDSFILGVFAILTTSLCVATFAITKDQIALNKKMALERALLEVVPADSHNNNMLEETLEVNHDLLGSDEAVTAYIAKRDQNPVAVVLPVRIFTVPFSPAARGWTAF